MDKVSAEKQFRLAVRQAIIILLGALEDYMIVLGELQERSIIPRRKREYNPPDEVTTIS